MQQELDFEAHKLVRKHDPITSREAAETARQLRSRHHTIILEVLEAKGSLTSQEIAEADERLEHWAVTRRMGELRDAGLVIQTQQRRRNKSGRHAFVWEKAK